MPLVNLTSSHRHALSVAQAQSALESLYVTLVSNIAIAVSLTLLIVFENGELHIVVWFASTVLLAAVRAWSAHEMKKAMSAEINPQGVLRTLTVFAFLSGLLWSIVPIAFDHLSSRQNIDLIAFIMAGSTTGAIIQSLAYSPISIAFGAPLMLATLYRLMSSGSSSSYVVAADALFLTMMLLRAALVGQWSFVASHVRTLEAVKLANSLEAANQRVSEVNQVLESMAWRDPLTGLANRAAFQEIAEDICKTGTGVSLALIDIDNFKVINDTRGHGVGDSVIRLLANQIRSICGEEDLPIRLGGDEFLVVFTGDEALRRAVEFADRLTASLLASITVGTVSIPVSCSIGIAAHTDTSIDVDALFSQADVALYRAKDAGRSCIRIFDKAMQANLDLQRSLDVDLQEAIRRHDLYLVFQPQVVMSTKNLIGFEALLRWKHPRLGMVAPPDIIDSALRLRLSEQLFRLISEQACAFARRISEQGIRDVKVAVNVSPREMCSHSPAKLLKEACHRHHVDPSSMEIEITEEALFDPKRCQAELTFIDECGFKLAIDDFGVGHSSISNLITVKIDTIKIDRSFVYGIAKNVRNQQLIAAISAVAMPLGQKIVAEGVENSEDEETLRILGCSVAQGWLYAKPMGSDEAIRWSLDHGHMHTAASAFV